MALKQKAKQVLRGNSTARRIYQNMHRARSTAIVPLARLITFERVPVPVAIHLAYQVMLNREPDQGAFDQLVPRLRRGGLDRAGLVEEIRGSEEFQNRMRFGGGRLGHSIHVGRQQFIRSLPKADVIVDLGGGHKANSSGALVALGYPYDFQSLTIIDLPWGDRHELYQTDLLPSHVQTERGPVTYEYRSMVELGDHADDSTDLVYSGQSIEHVPPNVGKEVLSEVFRILRPGGHLALDTPNGRITRIQQDEFIDPDHDVEYAPSELRALLEAAGFEVVFAKGLNYAGDAVATGVFDVDLVAGNSGLYDEYDDCYIMCMIARKPMRH